MSFNRLQNTAIKSHFKISIHIYTTKYTTNVTLDCDKLLYIE